MTRLDSTLQDQMIEWRHELHRYPEFGFEENRTSDFIAEKLNESGIEVIRNIGQTGLPGFLHKGNGERSVGLCADMDGLKIQEQNCFDYRSCHDGLMHACGHDGHSTMLPGAAKHLAAEGNFNGTVYFIFQLAEEHGKGALPMIADGLFERFTISEDFANMLHVKPGCYGLLGNGGGADGGCALHNPNYDFNDNILVKGAAYWVQLVENQLN